MKQTCDDFECIIVDDGSTDGTKQLIESYSDLRIRYIFLEHGERSRARNIGIEQATGRHICFLDDDDLLLEKYLENFNNEIVSDTYTECILRTGFIKGTDLHSAKRASLYRKEKHKNPISYVLKNMCGVWSLCIPRSYLKNICFPENFPHWQDTYFVLRLLAKFPLKQLQQYSYFYRIHEEMGSRYVISKAQLLERAEINVAAIQDYKDNYGHEISNYVNLKIFDFLVAEKYLQYAQLAKAASYKELKKLLIAKSLSFKCSLRFLKYYLRLL